MVQARGLNPFLGILHKEKHNHPALVGDLIEEFRCVVESTAIYLVNNKIIRASDFVSEKTSQVPFLLSDEGRKRAIQAFEETMQQITKHPDSGRSLSYRRCIEAQVRLLSQVMLSERPVYVPFRRGG